MSSKCPRILAIAGSDSGGGAGIQADIKTITMLGGHAMTAITAITAQNTTGLQAVHIVSTDMVIDQIESVVSDIGVDALKVGMIGSADTAFRVAKYCAQISVPIVFDPVMVATSGSTLSDSDTIAAFGELMNVASVVTPNLPELEALGGREAVLKHGCHLVVKDGHGSGQKIVDRLYSPTGMIKQVEGKRIDTDQTHGTGCTFSAALAFGLGKGMPLPDAFDQAVSFTRIAILEAPGIGRGSGPIGHQFVTDFQDGER